MEPPTPFAMKSFSKNINNQKIDLKLSSSENILSLSTELNNKKYRLMKNLENPLVFLDNSLHLNRH